MLMLQPIETSASKAKSILWMCGVSAFEDVEVKDNWSLRINQLNQENGR